VSDWVSISAKARDAAALLLRDREAGEKAFDRMLMSTPSDPMVLFERGKAFAQLGDLDRARSDLEQAVRRFSLQKFQKLARRELQRLPATPAPFKPLHSEIVSPAQALSIPTKAELARAHEVFRAREERAVDFDVALRLLANAFVGTYGLSPAEL
jgi:tetratricopeptide (TPR) repeat protein